MIGASRWSSSIVAMVIVRDLASHRHSLVQLVCAQIPPDGGQDRTAGSGEPPGALLQHQDAYSRNPSIWANGAAAWPFTVATATTTSQVPVCSRRGADGPIPGGTPSHVHHHGACHRTQVNDAACATFTVASAGHRPPPAPPAGTEPTPTSRLLALTAELIRPRSRVPRRRPPSPAGSPNRSPRWSPA